MKRVVSAVVVLFGLAAPAWADTKACEDAYERKDYETAMKVCRPRSFRRVQFPDTAQAPFAEDAPTASGLIPVDFDPFAHEAAEQGDASAQFTLALMYYDGRATEFTVLVEHLACDFSL